MLDEMVSFTALDRCDRCGAQAYAQADKPGQPSALLFCDHHSRKFKDSLLSQGWAVTWDEEKRKELVGAPGGSV